jgi:hypothetical protein
MSGDREEEWEQRNAGPVRAIHEAIEECCVLCGHENPFGGCAPIVRIIPLRIDSLVELLATFVELVLGKCK